MGTGGKWGKVCKHCRQTIPEGWQQETDRRKRDAMMARIEARRKAGLPIGRHKIEIDHMVMELRQKGLSLREIAKELDCSTTPIRRVCKELDL